MRKRTGGASDFLRTRECILQHSSTATIAGFADQVSLHFSKEERIEDSQSIIVECFEVKNSIFVTLGVRGRRRGTKTLGLLGIDRFGMPSFSTGNIFMSASSPRTRTH